MSLKDRIIDMDLKFKILAIVLILVLVAVIVFVCLRFIGGSGSARPDNNQPTVVDTTESEEEEEEEEEDERPDVEGLAFERIPARDLGGRNIRMLSWYNTLTILPDAEEPDELETDNYFVERMRWDNAMGVYNDWNVTASNVVVGWDDVPEILAISVMAGDPEGDLVRLDHAWILNAIVNGLLIPLEDILEADHDILTTQQYAWPTSGVMGKHWTMRHRMLFGDDFPFLGVNLDIIRSIGAENPAELYDRGEWTVDKFLEIARLATRDTTGSGSIDQFGIGGDANDILASLIAANDGIMVTDDLQYGWDHPHTMRAIEWAYQIFNVDKSWNFDPNAGSEFWDWSRNTYAFRDGNTAMFHAWTWTLPYSEDRTFDYTAVPYPLGPDNQHRHTFFHGPISGIGIPRGVQNPRDVFDVWYELGRWYGTDFDLKDEEDIESFIVRFQRMEDVDRIVAALLEGRKADIGWVVHVGGVGYRWMAGGMCEAFYNDTATPAQYVEEQRQIRQDMLDTIFGAIEMNP